MEIFGSSREVLGTQVHISVVDSSNMKSERLIKAAFNEFERIEKAFSRFIDGSQLAELNKNLGEWMPVSEEMYALLEFAQHMKAVSRDAFDITVNSILEGWGYDKEYSLSPSFEGQTGELELKDGMAKISAPIDFGGFGKGYALERAAHLMSSAANFCIDAGGDIYAKGHDAKGESWRMLFEHPLNEKQAIGYSDVDGKYLACSNPNKRKWADKHHLVDPRTNNSASNMLAVFTQADSGILADAYSTSLFVLGFETAKNMLDEFPVEAMLINVNGDIYRTKGFEGELF